MNLRLRSRAASTAVLTAAALTALTSCSSEPSPEDARAEAVTVAEKYMQAWKDEPAKPETRCELETKAQRPNFSEDGGTLKGCVKFYAKSEDSLSDDDRGTPKFSVDHAQDVPGSDTHPAGTGVLVTGKRPGEDQYRWALRLVQEEKDGQWLVEQVEEVRGRYEDTADPVAPILQDAS